MAFAEGRGRSVIASSSLETMDESRQERLFAESPGRISPPEPGLYLGTSGWSYADWEGTLYPQGLPAASRLAEYAKHYATVEIDSTFYGTPRRSTAEKWREIVPEGFRFAAKFPQEFCTLLARAYSSSTVSSGSPKR